MSWQKRPQHDGGLKLMHTDVVHTKEKRWTALGGTSAKRDWTEQLGLSILENLRAN